MTFFYHSVRQEEAVVHMETGPGWRRMGQADKAVGYDRLATPGQGV